MKELLKFEDINISYEKRQVLYDVSFSLDYGEILGIVGNSGCGKSTLLKSILGLAGPKVLSGNIYFEDSDLLAINSRDMRNIRGNRISMVFQESGIHTNPLKTIGDTVFESMKAHKQISKEDSLGIALDIFESLSLPEPKRILKAYPFELSGGMNQRVGIALAMLNNPSIILADEPTSALDPIVAVQIVNELKSLREKYNTAIILVTHNIKIARSITDNILILNDGKVVDYGKTTEVLSSPKSDFTKELILSSVT
ncbi:ABC transporter ATP-binding protein [Lachnoanaerobaculum umeaense]|uniref:ABC transporter ATP-binding protein n=1 Tax=Lachnoanaerobaculum umeaense TaxID=617123 RepID=A0A385Q2F7_9FIRM|nr:ABC transporter ATP-binding protein [Lachnoanaerobaculum umeaense]AYB00582.1 ABC transporter ATP-binding protein [Lachnoanaerobaculum umeaense]PZW92569.1 peptide/nickel transport system ATP-binding protein [Lachnoanaerobaculum umeaense]